MKYYNDATQNILASAALDVLEGKKPVVKEVEEPRAEGEKDFKAKHVVKKSGMKDDGTNIKEAELCEDCGKSNENCGCDAQVEGKVKDQMVADSEKMSKKDFTKKYGKEMADDLYEAKEYSYTVVHAKKGKVVVTAPTSYDAAQKAAKQWKLKSTGGVDAYLMKESVELDEAMGKLNAKGEIEMTAKNYAKVHKDYKTKMQGVPYAMQIDPKTGGTALYPVKIIKESVDDVVESVDDILDQMIEATTTEESDKQKKYKKFFDSALKKFGVNSPAELEGAKKKEFFDYVDANYEADNEED